MSLCGFRWHGPFEHEPGLRVNIVQYECRLDTGHKGSHRCGDATTPQVEFCWRCLNTGRIWDGQSEGEFCTCGRRGD